jgi:hypothetical protein
MKEPKQFEVRCLRTNRDVLIETRDWWVEEKENTKPIHYRGVCPDCGKEKSGVAITRAA